jgi:hypothetical protein
MRCIGLHARASTVEHETLLGPHICVWQSVTYTQAPLAAWLMPFLEHLHGVPPASAGWCSWRHSHLNRDETLPVDHHRTDCNFSLLLCRSCAFEGEVIGVASVRTTQRCRLVTNPLATHKHAFPTRNVRAAGDACRGRGGAAGHPLRIDARRAHSRHFATDVCLSAVATQAKSSSEAVRCSTPKPTCGRCVVATLL